jgi:prevent-host-death family protein
VAAGLTAAWCRRSSQCEVAELLPFLHAGNLGEILRRAKAGEEFTITVSGRPTAHLGPAAPQPWVTGARLRAIWATPTPETLAQDLERFPGDLVDPFS